MMPMESYVSLISKKCIVMRISNFLFLLKGTPLKLFLKLYRFEARVSLSLSPYLFMLVWKLIIVFSRGLEREATFQV